MKRYFTLGLLALIFTISSCSKETPPLPEPPPTVYKQNAYELRLLTKKLPDGRTVFLLNKNTFVKGSQVSHAVVAVDTLPMIGEENATYVNQDEEGDQEVTSQVVAKQYDVLFKVDTLEQTQSGLTWDTASVKRDSVRK